MKLFVYIFPTLKNFNLSLKNLLPITNMDYSDQAQMYCGMYTWKEFFRIFTITVLEEGT